MPSKQTRTEAIRGKGRRVRAFELSDEASDLIEQVRRQLNERGVIPHCSGVQALEVLIRQGFKEFNKSY